jgi:SAM-dependent methyltransferase
MTPEYTKQNACGICNSKDRQFAAAYGKVPLAGDFPKTPNDINRYPLNIMRCRSCNLVQTDSLIDPVKLFRNYRYASSYGLKQHFQDVAEMLVTRFQLNELSNVVEIGSNDGVLQLPLKERGILAIGIDPACNIVQRAKDLGCYTIPDFFNLPAAKRHFIQHGTDLVLCNNCFAHIADIPNVVEGIKFILKPHGYFVFEVAYVRDIVESLQFDNVYHEHIYYWSVTALHNMFSRYGMTIVNVEEIPVHSGSIRVTVDNAEIEIPTKVKKYLQLEKDLGMLEDKYYEVFASRAQQAVDAIRDYVKDAKEQGKVVVGYGASGRANMLANLAKLDKTQVQFICDESPERQGRYLAGLDIPIVGPERLGDEVDIVIVFAWNFAEKTI